MFRDKLSGARRDSVRRVITNAMISLVILSAGAGGLVVYGKRGEVPTHSSVLDAAGAAAAVITAEVRTWDLPVDIRVDGEVSAFRVITVGAEISGRIVQKPQTSRNGMFVGEGDLLIAIDPQNYELEVKRLEARLEREEAELDSLHVDRENAESILRLAKEEADLQFAQLQRLRTLWERRATSETELDNAQRQELAARNTMQVQQNLLRSLDQQVKVRTTAVRLAAVELERARADLDKCRVIATISGRIVDDPVEEGDYVQVGDTLMHLSDAGRMDVKCSLRGEEMAWILVQSGQVGETTADREFAQLTTHSIADPFPLPRVRCDVIFKFEDVETIWEGYLDRCEGTGVDRDTRMFPCRIVVDRPLDGQAAGSPGGRAVVSPPALLSGMYVTIRIPVISPEPLLQVPLEAVRPGGQLWVVRDNVLQIVYGSVAKVEGEAALIRREGEALAAGDRVVTSPLAAVVSGMVVRDMTERPDSGSREGAAR